MDRDSELRLEDARVRDEIHEHGTSPELRARLAEIAGERDALRRARGPVAPLVRFG